MAIGARLKEERKRLKMTQAEFAEAGGIGVSALKLYEGEDRDPGAQCLYELSTIGLDAQYVITGIRSKTALASDEKLLLDGYRSLDLATRKHTLAFVLTESGPAAVSRKIKELVADQAQKQIAVNAIGDGAIAAGKKITNRGKKAVIVSGDNNSLGNK